LVCGERHGLERGHFWQASDRAVGMRQQERFSHRAFAIDPRACHRPETRNTGKAGEGGIGTWVMFGGGCGLGSPIACSCFELLSEVRYMLQTPASTQTASRG